MQDHDLLAHAYLRCSNAHACPFIHKLHHDLGDVFGFVQLRQNNGLGHFTQPIITQLNNIKIGFYDNNLLFGSLFMRLNGFTAGKYTLRALFCNKSNVCNKSLPERGGAN